MKRTTIMLPNDLRARAMRCAKERGDSLGGLVRDALAVILDNTPKGVAEDPLFNDYAVFSGEAPSDLSRNHDRYLYGEQS